MLFAGCGKDDAGPGDGGSQQVSSLLTIDGITYPMTVTTVDTMTFRAVDAAGQRFVITGGIRRSELGNNIDLTWDLTQPAEGIPFGFVFESSMFFYLVYENTGERITGVLDNTPYDGESIFLSGTATVRCNAEGLYVSVSGTLKNGHSFAYRLFTSAQPGVEQPLAPNELMVGDVCTPVVTTLSLTNEGVCLFDAVGNVDGEAVDMALDLPLALLGTKVNLYTLEGEEAYKIVFNSLVVSFSQQYGHGSPYAELNGRSLQSAAFLEGSMEFSFDEHNATYSVVVKGRLVDGTPFGAHLQVPVEAIQALDYQAVFDGQPYPLDYTLTLQGDEYTLFASGYEPHCVAVGATPFFHIRVLFAASALGREVDLSESNPEVDYSIELTGPNLPIELPTPFRFARGALSLGQDSGGVSISFTGTLSNGHAISMKASVDTPQIIHRDSR